MAQSLVVEEESGTFRGVVHPHNGYYAGDFSKTNSIGSGGTAAAVIMISSGSVDQGAAA
jgi:hypothetical protein